MDASEQDDAFQARYGKSQDDCWQGVDEYCTSNQTGSETFVPSCGPGKQLNSDLASACIDSLASETCDEWPATPAGDCDSVCSSASNPGSGEGSGDTSSDSTATARDFCKAVASSQCERLFDCKPAQADAVVDVDECKAALGASCSNPSLCPGGYDAEKGAACVMATKTATCEELMGPAPEACSTACQ